MVNWVASSWKEVEGQRGGDRQRRFVFGGQRVVVAGGRGEIDAVMPHSNSERCLYTDFRGQGGVNYIAKHDTSRNTKSIQANVFAKIEKKNQFTIWDRVSARDVF
jgi:hypothetical protein